MVGLILPLQKPVFAKRKIYSVETGNENILCKFKFLSKKEKKNLFKKPQEFLIETDLKKVEIEQKQIVPGKEVIVGRYSLDPVPKNYTILHVKIKNNSDQAIYIAPDSYLDGLDNTQKSTLARFYRPKLPESDMAAGIALSIAGLICVWGIPYAIIKSDDDILDETSKKALAATSIVISLIPLILAPSNFLERSKLRKQYLKIAECTKKYLAKDKKNTLQRLSEETFLIKLEPGEVIDDLIFVNVNKISPNFFDKNELSLIYELEP